MTRKISDEEKRLWKFATRGVKGKTRQVAEPEPLDGFIPRGKVKITPQVEMSLPKPAPKKLPRELVAGKVNAMDGGSFKRLFKGKQKIEASIDLHGMWLSDAHVAVRDFVEMSYAGGKRCVLVITGKGGITGDGKIRSEFPKWLNDPDIRRHILSFTHAIPEHGGTGAFYVYLRK